MPDIDTMKTSNYLKKEDVGQGVPVTIREVIEGNIAQEGKPVDLKWLIYFNQFEKPLVSNVTHREQIAAYLGSRNSDDWIGKPIVLFNDPSVIFNNNVGGIRVRPTQQQGYGNKTQQQNHQQNPQQNHQQNPQQNPYNNQQQNPNGAMPDLDDDIPDFI